MPPPEHSEGLGGAIDISADGAGALERAGERGGLTSEEALDGELGAAGMEHCYFIASRPSPLTPTPEKYLGPNFFNFAFLFLGRWTPLLFLS